MEQQSRVRRNCSNCKLASCGQEDSSQVNRALMIPEILEHILKYCDVRNLKVCRSVSKLWRDTAIRSWNESAVVKISTVVGITRRREVAMVDFLKFLDRNKRCDIDKLYVNFDIQIQFPLQELTHFNSFWEEVGPRVKSLRISDCTFPSRESIRKVLFHYCPNMVELYIGHLSVNCKKVKRSGHVFEKTRLVENSNLKSLTINCMDLSNVGITWMELLNCFSSIEVLNLTHGVERNTIQEIFSAVNILRGNDPTKFRLKHLRARVVELESFDTIPDALLQFLGNGDIRLESLSLSVNGYDGGVRLQEILNVHGASLKTLICGRATRTGYLNPEDTFPLSIRDQMENRLVNLQVLRIHSRVFANFHYLKYMPNLQKVSITDSFGQGAAALIKKTNISSMRDVLLCRCVELELGNFVPVQELQHLVKWFPNVERLRMHLDNESFSLVCKTWTRLVSLDITCVKMNECGFTGLDEDHVKMVNTAKGEITCRPPTVQMANIGSFKHLRRLSMENDRGYPIMSLSYAAAQFGIHKLHSLYLVKMKRINFDPHVLLESFKKLKCSRPFQEDCTYYVKQL